MRSGHYSATEAPESFLRFGTSLPPLPALDSRSTCSLLPIFTCSHVSGTVAFTILQFYNFLVLQANPNSVSFLRLCVAVFCFPLIEVVLTMLRVVLRDSLGFCNPRLSHTLQPK